MTGTCNVKGIISSVNIFPIFKHILIEDNEGIVVASE